jgi:hypothetical protein
LDSTNSVEESLGYVKTSKFEVREEPRCQTIISLLCQISRKNVFPERLENHCSIVVRRQPYSRFILELYNDWYTADRFMPFK